MIKAGDVFTTGNTWGIVGALIPWGDKYFGVTPAHIFHYAKTKTLWLNGLMTKVAHFSHHFDMAFFSLMAGTPTAMDKPRLGHATLENMFNKRHCRISNVNWSLVYVVLQPRDAPEPGDSGTPVVQDGKVVGMLLSMSLDSYRGVVISSEAIEKELEMIAKR